MPARALVAALLLGALAGNVGGERTAPAIPYVWHLPPGVPRPKVPADNPMSEAKVRLGRRLFYDTRLSGNGTQACASCHNVHGSTNVKLLKVGTTVDESCTSCHADKRGPYLWEHAPVSESCVTCHDPHGSNNDRMLVSKVPFLCQRCHVTSRHPPTVYEGFLLQNSQNANKIFTRGCVACHQMVHGSNSPSGKTLLR